MVGWLITHLPTPHQSLLRASPASNSSLKLLGTTDGVVTVKSKVLGSWVPWTCRAARDKEGSDSHGARVGLKKWMVIMAVWWSGHARWWQRGWWQKHLPCKGDSECNVESNDNEKSRVLCMLWHSWLRLSTSRFRAMLYKYNWLGWTIIMVGINIGMGKISCVGTHWKSLTLLRKCQTIYDSPKKCFSFCFCIYYMNNVMCGNVWK